MRSVPPFTITGRIRCGLVLGAALLVGTSERAVRGGNCVFDDAPERLTGWDCTVSWRNPATGHRQIGVRRAVSD